MPETLARKLGPLPVYVWALIVVAAYLVYTRYKSNAASGTGGSANGTNPVPGFDAAGLSGGGGIGAAQLPDVVTNVYLPADDAAQASGGGTGGSTTPTTPSGSTGPAGSGPYPAASSSYVTTPAPSSVVVSPAGVTSTRPAGTVSPGGAITGRGVVSGP